MWFIVGVTGSGHAFFKLFLKNLLENLLDDALVINHNILNIQAMPISKKHYNQDKI